MIESAANVPESLCQLSDTECLDLLADSISNPFVSRLYPTATGLSAYYV